MLHHSTLKPYHSRYSFDFRWIRCFVRNFTSNYVRVIKTSKLIVYPTFAEDRFFHSALFRNTSAHTEAIRTAMKQCEIFTCRCYGCFILALLTLILTTNIWTQICETSTASMYLRFAQMLQSCDVSVPDDVRRERRENWNESRRQLFFEEIAMHRNSKRWGDDEMLMLMVFQGGASKLERMDIFTKKSRGLEADQGRFKAV